MKKILALLVIVSMVACSPARLYLHTYVVDKADSTKFHLKTVRIARLKPGVLNIGDTVHMVKVYTRSPRF